MTLKYFDGDPYYETLPEGFKSAVLDDFYLLDHLVIDKPYLIHSEILQNHYWAKRTIPGFMNHNDFYTFLERGRVFVLK